MWSDPLLYELEFADDPEFDLAFWRAICERVGARRVLELACGTGRLTLPLARSGVSVVGIDTSAPFLRYARERLALELADVRSRVELLEADMRAPGLSDRFDLVIVPFSSLAYLHSPADQLACLRASRALVADGGAFAFDLVAPHMTYLAEAQQICPMVRVDADHPVPSQGLRRMVRTYADRYDAATQTLTSSNTYVLQHDDGTIEHRLNDTAWHMYFPRELEQLLAAAGFAVRDRWGTYDFTPWTGRSARYLWLCEPA
jgi:SAM-dependent methyltransferase